MDELGKRVTREPVADATEQVQDAAVPVGIADGQEHGVDPRSVTAARITAIPWIAGIALAPFVIVTLVWALGGGIPNWLYSLLASGWVAITGCALFSGYAWPALRFRRLSYCVDETGVRIRRGVLWRKVISMPASRVQHTDVSQGPVQRHFEIATLTVYTAGTLGASVSLSGLEHGVAQRLREHLLPDPQVNAG